MRREIFADGSRLYGTDDSDVILDAEKLVESLIEANLFKEAMSLLRDMIPTARRVLGEGNKFTLYLRAHYARAIYRNMNSSRDVHEAVAILEDVLLTSRRVLGNQHPHTEEFLVNLETAHMRLADDESRAALAAPAPPTRRRRHRRRPK